ncbi:hypothetical protein DIENCEPHELON_56 [Klebsiella phage vB_KaeS_Diencephalon]|nr:hypothetical protein DIENCEPHELON_56 [Klebsiella phage vB_KaeS_Diencephalon]
MERFAKVFEVNGRQLLVMKSATSDDEPKLSAIMRFDDGMEMDLGPVFKTDDELNAAFDQFDQERAERFTAPFAGLESTAEVISVLAGRNEQKDP